MQDILKHINSVEGVIGSAVFSDKGNVLVHAFPALIDAASLQKAASLVLECSHGLQISQTLDILDLRYSDGRILAKLFPGATLFLLCTKNINLQMLSITLNLAVRKLEPKLAKETSDSGSSSVTVEPVSADGALLLAISHLANKQASASFDSLGMVAVSQSTAQYISDYYKAPIKKLTLTNAVAGTSGTFPVMVMKDMDQTFDGTVVIGPGIEKKLKVGEGDKVEVKIG